MKKKVIAVLLASMMATSMVPVTAMAEDQPDVVSAEETQDLSEDTETEDQGFFEEETDVQEAETKAPAEEESQEEDSRCRAGEERRCRFSGSFPGYVRERF